MDEMAMTSLARLVKQMRDAQQQYFATRSSAWLQAARTREKQVDRMLATILGEEQTDEPSLFGEENDS